MNRTGKNLIHRLKQQKTVRNKGGTLRNNERHISGVASCGRALAEVFSLLSLRSCQGGSQRAATAGFSVKCIMAESQRRQFPDRNGSWSLKSDLSYVYIYIHIHTLDGIANA